jgi:hypothetical protein
LDYAVNDFLIKLEKIEADEQFSHRFRDNLIQLGYPIR